VWDGENKHLPLYVVAPFIFRVLGDSVDSPNVLEIALQKRLVMLGFPPFPRVLDAWVVVSRKLPIRQTLVLAYY
jgi:hypothetical protein